MVTRVFFIYEPNPAQVILNYPDQIEHALQGSLGRQAQFATWHSTLRAITWLIEKAQEAEA